MFTGDLATAAPIVFDANTTIHVQDDTTPVIEAVVLVNRRTKNTAGEWSDAEPTRHRIKAWNRLATNIATLPKGARVLVVGHTETEAWTDNQTQGKRTADVIVVDAIGASLRYATVTYGPDAGATLEAN
ncbi:single-stranded DNA-binding protein [Aeromicrobium sp.]|uniref:single-stranded DNA-binding protein n=1 Tax=Aeromicrobium sp. TaxID=1871063 RepID=UPI0019CB866A|nr:single-stranded DNA-binding protein [Aeromicrobium sp.]MBC7631407.1 single-stranded DNA-binding protein [Aeromicrobium sp.]